jgi:hypothetical protein
LLNSREWSHCSTSNYVLHPELCVQIQIICSTSNYLLKSRQCAQFQIIRSMSDHVLDFTNVFNSRLCVKFQFMCSTPDYVLNSASCAQLQIMYSVLNITVSSPDSVIMYCLLKPLLPVHKYITKKYYGNLLYDMHPI